LIGRFHDRREADDSIPFPLRPVEHGIVVVEQRQAEDGLIGLLWRGALRNLEDGLAGGGIIGLPIGRWRAGEPNGFAIAAGEDEVNPGPFGQIEEGRGDAVVRSGGLADHAEELGVEAFEGLHDGLEDVVGGEEGACAAVNDRIGIGLRFIFGLEGRGLDGGTAVDLYGYKIGIVIHIMQDVYVDEITGIEIGLPFAAAEDEDAVI